MRAYNELELCAHCVLYRRRWISIFIDRQLRRHQKHLCAPCLSSPGEMSQRVVMSSHVCESTAAAARGRAVLHSGGFVIITAREETKSTYDSWCIRRNSYIGKERKYDKGNCLKTRQNAIQINKLYVRKYSRVLQSVCLAFSSSSV